MHGPVLMNGLLCRGCDQTMRFMHEKYSETSEDQG
jgi:hypothetical protein